MQRPPALLLIGAITLTIGIALWTVAETLRPMSVGQASIPIDRGGEPTSSAQDAPETKDEAQSATVLMETILKRLPAPPIVIEVNRVSLPAGASLAGLLGPGPEVLFVEAGAIAVQVSSTKEVAGGPSALRPGDLVTVPTGSPFTIKNEGQITAVLLEVALRSTTERSPGNDGIDAAALSSRSLVPGVSVQRLGICRVVAFPSGGAGVLEISRLTLPPEFETAPYQVPMADMIAVVAGASVAIVGAGEGQAHLIAGGETIVGIDTGRERRDFRGRELGLSAGESIAFPAKTRYAIRGQSPSEAVMLVVRIKPSDDSGR